MTARAIDRRQYEERDSDSNVPMMILTAVALFGAAILLLYIYIASPQAGTAMGTIRNVLYSLGGNVGFALPLMLVWAGVLCLQSVRGREISPFAAACDVLLFVCFFTAVQLFSVETIRQSRMTIDGFTNFVVKSYGYGGGGGAIGAILAWPLYKGLGVAGGFMAVLLFSLLLFTATGRTGRIVRFARLRYARSRERLEQTRREEKVETRQQRENKKITVRQDPQAEMIVNGGKMPVETAAAGRPVRRARPASGPARREGSSRAEPADPVRGNAINIQENRTPPRRRPSAERQMGPAASGIRRPVPQADAASVAADRPRPQAAKPPRNPAKTGRGKQLYNEDLQKSARRRPRARPGMPPSGLERRKGRPLPPIAPPSCGRTAGLWRTFPKMCPKMYPKKTPEIFPW